MLHTAVRHRYNTAESTAVWKHETDWGLDVEVAMLCQSYIEQPVGSRLESNLLWLDLNTNLSYDVRTVVSV